MTQNTSPAPGTPEYEAAMEAKGAALENPSPAAENTPERPQWLPEKFKSPEDLAKAYAELEKRMSAGGAKPAAALLQPVATPATPAAATEPAAATPEQAAQTLQAGGLNMDEFSQEFAQTGALSEASYAKLTAAGIPKVMVDAYIAGQQAQVETLRASVVASVGGEEGYASMTKWATANLNATEIAAYNQAVESGNTEMVKLAVQGLHARYAAANPAEPRLLQGSTGNTGAEKFESRAQMVAAMRDPRYKTDPAYRKAVERKLEHSDIF